MTWGFDPTTCGSWHKRDAASCGHIKSLIYSVVQAYHLVAMTLAMSPSERCLVYGTCQPLGNAFARHVKVGFESKINIYGVSRHVICCNIVQYCMKQHSLTY